MRLGLREQEGESGLQLLMGLGKGAFSAGKWQVKLWSLVQGRQRLKIVGQAGMPREVAGVAGQRAEAP